MGDLFLAVGLRRGMNEAVVEVHRTDARELSDLACEIASRVSGLDALAFYWLASESVTRFDLEALDAMREERFERETFARLKAKFEPAAVVGVPGPVAVGYAVPFGETPHEVAGKINADPDAPFTAVVVDGVVRLHQVVRGASSLVVTPEGLVGPEFDANGDRVLHNGMKLPDRAGCIDGADYLAQLLRWFRPRLSMSAALTAAREARPIETFTPTETAIRVFADRASALDDALAAVQGLAKEPITPEEPSPDGVAFLASMARGRRAALSEASCLAAARELYHKLGGYSTASAALAVADRAALLEAGIPPASIVGGP